MTEGKRNIHLDKFLTSVTHERVYGRSFAEIVGSNPTGGMDVCLF